MYSSFFNEERSDYSPLVLFGSRWPTNRNLCFHRFTLTNFQGNQSFFVDYSLIWRLKKASLFGNWLGLMEFCGHFGGVSRRVGAYSGPTNELFKQTKASLLLIQRWKRAILIRRSRLWWKYLKIGKTEALKLSMDRCQRPSRRRSIANGRAVAERCRRLQATHESRVSITRHKMPEIKHVSLLRSRVVGSWWTNYNFVIRPRCLKARLL